MRNMNDMDGNEIGWSGSWRENCGAWMDGGATLSGME
eukprot:CAMPEP_0172444492 /NCGR_PEP_ID=MMETSP1065-20121228/4519_1 /TAXON_ID=265537 /ORGANISM="Amphiprora paludosa, Strain CCMP125" /LENGTH=36 /DNA_ID= /DNA_START= /DNA_END= /DNA_ORIENTATION=